MQPAIEEAFHRAAREAFLRGWPYALFLTKEQRADFVAGRCRLSEYDGVPIIDYRVDA